MRTMEIAIDIGTMYTSIFVSGNGIVLHEKTAIAYNGDLKRKNIRAVGDAAYDMIGKAPDKTTIITPVVDGIISDGEAMLDLLGAFMKKIMPDAFFLPRVKAIVSIPMGLKPSERRVYENVVFLSCKQVKYVTLIESVVLAANGLDLPITTSTGGLVTSIGAGCTDIAALSLSGIISGCGINIGGNMMDKAIRDGIAGKFDLNIGMGTVEKIKIQIGSLYVNDTNKKEVDGADIRTKNIDKCVIHSNDLYDILYTYYMRIGDSIESIINMCPPDIGSDFKRTGIYIVGGAAQIGGLEQFLSKRLGVDVIVPENAEFLSIIGAGKLLTNKELLKELLTQIV